MSRNNYRQILGERWEEYQRDRKQLKLLRHRRKNVNKVIEWRRQTKQKLIQYKGGKCQRCGFSKNIPSAYDFHHNDPSKKEFQLTETVRKYELLLKEADKCTLLCKICHAEVHAESVERNREVIEKKFDRQIESIEQKWVQFRKM